MSTVKSNALQLGQSLTATNNFTWYQPSTPDGTVRLGIGNAGATSGDVLIASSTGISTPSLVVSGSTAPTNGMFLPTTNTLAWSTNSTERLRLDSSGNLGMGVTPSAWNAGSKVLQLGSTSSLEHYSGIAVNLFQNAYRNSSNQLIYLSSAAATLYGQNTGQHQWYTAPSGTAGNAITFTQAMTLDASGNLLVGATSGGSGKLRVTADSFATSYSSPSCAYFFSSNSTDANCVEIFQGRYNKAALSISANNTGTQTAISFYEAGNVVGSVTTTTTNTAYNTSSDQRLKTNIAPAGSAIQSILDFPVDQFDWISSGEHQDFGAVAQKAINFIPEMVSVPADEEEMWGIDWSKAVPRLIKTIQELSSQVSDLNAELNELKGKIA